MTVPNDTVEANRVTDNLDVEVLSREDEVFEVTNLSHENPEEHEYKVFCEGDDAVHCECPAFEFGNGLDDSGRCKHMRIVEQFIPHLEWTDYQVLKKREEEEARRQHMQEQKEAVFADGGEVGDRDELTENDQEFLDENGDLLDFDEYMEQTTIERAIEECERDDGPTTAEDVLESAKAAVEAYESVEEQAKETREEMPSKDEWRSMSNEGRKRLSAWV